LISLIYRIVVHESCTPHRRAAGAAVRKDVNIGAADLHHRVGQVRQAVEGAAREQQALVESTLPIRDQIRFASLRYAWPFFIFPEEVQLIPIMAVANKTVWPQLLQAIGTQGKPAESGISMALPSI
jgi:hypothetical protein